MFFLLLAFIEDRFISIVLNQAETNQELLRFTTSYFVQVVIFSFFLTIIFTAPLNFILKIKNALYFWFGIAIFICIEYITYTYLASPSDKILGLYNAAIGLVLLYAFFHRSIREKGSMFT